MPDRNNNFGILERALSATGSVITIVSFIQSIDVASSRNNKFYSFPTDTMQLKIVAFVMLEFLFSVFFNYLMSAFITLGGPFHFLAFGISILSAWQSIIMFWWIFWGDWAMDVNSLHFFFGVLIIYAINHICLFYGKNGNNVPFYIKDGKSILIHFIFISIFLSWMSCYFYFNTVPIEASLYLESTQPYSVLIALITVMLMMVLPAFHFFLLLRHPETNRPQRRQRARPTNRR